MQPAADTVPAGAQLTPVTLQPLPLAAGMAASALGAVQLAVHGWRPPVLWMPGLLLGATLHHRSVGFASAYWRMILARDTRGVQAQLLLLAILAGGAAWRAGDRLRRAHCL